MSEEKISVDSFKSLSDTSDTEVDTNPDITDDEAASRDNTAPEAAESDAVSLESKNILESTDEDASEHFTGTVRRRPLFRAPIIIAACIFLCTLIGFGVWKCFFDTTITGDWAVEVTSNDGEKKLSYTFSFDDDHTFRMRSGGTSLVGKYYFDKKKNSDGTEDPVFSIYLTNLGSRYIYSDFGYSFDGNAFTGRILKLTDYNGLFFPSDDSSSDEETVKYKKSITDSIERDGITYYVWDFMKTDFTNKIEYFDDFKVDTSILGSWLYKEETSGYAYTLTFYDDGRFEQLSYESELNGSYKYSQDESMIRYYSLVGELVETPVTISIDGDTLTFNGLKYTKTTDKNDYKTHNNN